MMVDSHVRLVCQLEVIGIDEAQFFPDLDAFCRQAADRDHKEVVVAGLDGDFKRWARNSKPQNPTSQTQKLS